MPPLLTIGLPVYNAAPFLEGALRSIAAQTFTDWELIVVDDGSSDQSPAILQAIKDARARVEKDRQHRGLGARLNQIVGMAKGKYIARMDADDLMHPDRLAKQIAFLEQHGDVDVVGCGLVSFDRDYRPMSVRRLPSEHDSIVAHPLGGILLAHATVVGRAAWWRKHPYNESHNGCEDWELWLSSYGESRFANLSQALYFYREQQAYSFDEYVRDKKELASLFWKAGNRFGPGAGWAAASQWARIGAYGVARVLGLDSALVRRRGARPDPEEVRIFRNALDRINAVEL